MIPLESADPRDTNKQASVALLVEEVFFIYRNCRIAVDRQLLEQSFRCQYQNGIRFWTKHGKHRLAMIWIGVPNRERIQKPTTTLTNDMPPNSQQTYFWEEVVILSIDC